MSSFRAVIDADVLFIPLTRDLLIRLALHDVYRALWSDTILAELRRALLAREIGGDHARLEKAMREALPYACVERYADLVPSLTLPDPNDRHVLAAAIVGGAAVIVTRNLRHFPAGVLDNYEIEAQHPDIFLEHAYSLDPTRFVRVAAEMRAALKRPPLTVAELLDAMRRSELPTVAAVLADHADVL